MFYKASSAYYKMCLCLYTPLICMNILRRLRKIGSKTIFRQKKRPSRANPRRSENPLFMRFISDYSMIEATLPEPTVLPPSRYQTDVLRCANGDFSCDLYGKIRIFHCVRVVLGDFVIMVLSQYLCIYLHICIYTI